LALYNPAKDEVIGYLPLSGADDVHLAAQAAAKAFQSWRRIPPPDRIQYLFRLKKLLDDNLEELTRSITIEHGKTLGAARGEMRRAIENVEVACGIPTLMQGQFSEDIAVGIDEYMIRKPVGVCAIIAPFNFPGMIPFWFLPYALATGNTCIIKPSEKTPMTMQKVFNLFEQAGFPQGVVNLVNGGAEAVNALLDHPIVRAISFVGSTPVAKHVYFRGTANGKRVQAQGGAKNALVVMPDADLDSAIRIIADSAYGNAGQRCLATSLVVTVGEARQGFTESIAATARSYVVGSGLDEGVQMGPVISRESKQRIETLI
jgi:malonate-semialdehyde dehydrogenase (acetylating)/methylmalonate-semialdehyde dehydrogenase